MCVGVGGTNQVLTSGGKDSIMAALARWVEVQREPAKLVTSVSPALRLMGCSLAGQEPKLKSGYHLVKERKGVGMSLYTGTVSGSMHVRVRVCLHAPFFCITAHRGTRNRFVYCQNHFRACFKSLSKKQ